MDQNEKQPVFILDDDVLILRSLQRLFSSEGLLVVPFMEPLRFLEAIPQSCLGCAVLDMQMPGMTGLQVHHELRRRGNDIPVIFLTGQSDPATRLEAKKSGAFDFFAKPWEPSMLIASVFRAMAQNQEKQIR